MKFVVEAHGSDVVIVLRDGPLASCAEVYTANGKQCEARTGDARSSVNLAIDLHLSPKKYESMLRYQVRS